MNVPDTIRAAIGETRGTLDRLEALLAGEHAGQLPGLDLARLALDLDRAAGKLASHADRLGAELPATNGRRR